VLLITIDTLRTDRLGCYSHERLKTPLIDSRAARGVVFTRAFAHTSTTLASHTNILLGMTPLYHGIHDNLNFKVREEFMTLAEYLKPYGYATGAFLGAFPLDSKFGLSQGFDTYDDGDFWSSSFGDEVSPERPAGAVVDRALEWLDGCSSPWFMWVHCFDPHHPYDPPEPFRTAYRDDPYSGEVAYVDHELGRLFAYLEKNRMEENTLIILTGDHGESLGEHGEKTHGAFAYNSTISIPLLFCYPGAKPQIVQQNVSHIDIFPTVCDILKIEKPPLLQGLSLVPCFEGKKLKSRKIYFESLSPYYNFGWAPIRGIIEDKKKYIDSPIPEIYDLEKDFGENNNMAQQSELAAYRKMLSQIMASQESRDSVGAEKGADKATLEKLKSLGYIGSYPGERKKEFGPEEDAKVLLPYHYKSEEALELKEKGKPAEGIELLKEVITEIKTVSKAYSNLAAIYRSQGKLESAIQVLRMGREFIPDSYMIFSGYLGYLSEAGRWEEVLSVFEGSTFKQLEFDPYVWDLAGQAYLQTGDFENALLFCERAVTIDEEYAISYSHLGSIHFQMFNSTRDPEELSRASLNFEKALRLDPAISSAQDGLGLIHMYKENYEKAIYHLEKALQLQPDLDHTVYNLGIANLRNGNWEGALFYLNQFKNTPSYNKFSREEKEMLEKYIGECRDRLFKISSM
jgi:arylsulfatase A-like enzyme/Tfp pilus assembly protein PilF